MPEARYTLVCLETSIYIHSKNTSDLYDIVKCNFPSVSSAIYRHFEDRLVLAYLSLSDERETIEVHDYSVCPRTGMDTVYTITKPFGAGYKIGGM